MLRKICFHFQILLLSLVSLAFGQDVEIQQDVVAEAIPDQIVVADNQVSTFYQFVIKYWICYNLHYLFT